jgi:hypothetical protein
MASEPNEPLRPLLHHVIARRMAGLKRHLFRGSTPKWVEDVYNFVEYVNFLRLAPTFVGLLVAPRHFFRRFPQIHKGQTSLYVTPVTYLWYSLLFTVAMAFIVYPNVPGVEHLYRFSHDYIPEWATHWLVLWGEYLAFLSLLLFCFFSPLWIVPTSWMLLGIYRFTDSAFRNAGDLQTSYEMSKPVPDHTLFFVPFSREVYQHIDRTRFAWGLFYFGITSFLMLHVVGIAVVASFYGFTFFVSRMSGMQYLPAFMLIPFLLLPATLGKRLLVQPYVELLRAAQRTPSTQIQFADLENIKFTVDLLVAGLVDLTEIEAHQSKFGIDRYPKSQERKDYLEEQRKERIGDIHGAALEFGTALSRLWIFWRTQDFDLRNERCAIRSEFIAARQRACQRELQLPKVKELLGQTSVNKETAALIQSSISKLEARLIMPSWD